jgi:vacuolar-type H+-ATPase subunit E/Vma4
MPLEKITERILNDARKAAEKILGKAKDDAGRIRSRAEKRIAEYELNAVKEAEAHAAAKKAQMIHSAERMARNRILKHKQEWIDRVFEAVKAEILDFSDETYLTFLVDLLKKTDLRGNEEIGLAGKDLKLQKRLQNILQESFPNNQFRFGVSPFPMEAGLVVKKGQMFLNASVEALLGEMREQESRKVAQILFEEEDGDEI